MNITDMAYNCTNSYVGGDVTYCDFPSKYSSEALQRLSEAPYDPIVSSCMANSQDLAREAGFYKTALAVAGIMAAIGMAGAYYLGKRAGEDIENDNEIYIE